MDSINVSQIEIIEVECVCVLFSVCELTSKPHHRSSWGVPLARYTSHIKLTTSSKKLLFLLECCFLFDPYCFCLPAHPSKSPLLIGSSPANCYGQATSWPCSVVKKCYKKQYISTESKELFSCDVSHYACCFRRKINFMR